MKYFYLLLIFATPLVAQELPPIQNFSPKDYHGENQNWAISQSAEKLIYVANSNGLLEYNGATWNLYPSPNETIIRSVQVVGERIYTGCFMEFGYWKKNNSGLLAYTSLSKELGIPLLEDEEFWTIIDLDDWIVFQSLKRIYILNVKTNLVNSIDAENTITKMFKLGESIYFQRSDKGIFKIKAGLTTAVFEGAITKNDEIIDIFGTEKNPLILTKNNGFYQNSEEGMVPAPNFPNQLLSSLSLYDGIQLQNGGFALGTISDGLIYLDKQGAIKLRINQNNGLSNNTVLALFEDLERNIWLGLDNGISYVNTNAPFEVFNDDKGILGSIYASAINNGYLYLGTNQGLFYKKLGSADNYTFIAGTQGQVWCLEEIDGTLLCGHHKGTFSVEGDQIKKIASIPGTWEVSRIAHKPGLLLQGNYDGLYVLEKSGSSWILKNKINGFNNSSRYFETIDNEIFVNHEYNGVFKITVDDAFFNVKSVAIDTSIQGSNSGIVRYNQDLLYAYKKGVFKYNAPSGRFIKDSLLSKVYTEETYESGKLVVDQKENLLWVFTKPNISYISPAALSAIPKIKSIPLTKEMRNGILGYEHIVRLNDNSDYLIGTASGYITVDLDELKPKNFQVRIGTIVNGTGEKNTKRTIDRSAERTFSSEENTLKISFYAPEFNKFLSTHYQFQLQGIYDDWSDWSEQGKVTFENLPYGEYTFKVRAKIGESISSNTASYAFKIAKPWYVSNLLLVLYALGVFLFSVFMHTSYKHYYSKQQEKLIEKNRRELELAQVQNEKEIIRLKNEQLQLDVKGKGKELAASTMSIIKKNELLTTIKNELGNVSDKDAVKPVIKIIDKSLKQNDDWELFQEAFNNADSEFLKNIKALHPSLSPNDLKLCAYLRLNLSSKEIAQLLHISARSVEIKRYRLRKKLQLQREDNLVNYILEL